MKKRTKVKDDATVIDLAGRIELSFIEKERLWKVMDSWASHG